MNLATMLRKRIRDEFAEVPFPEHCGLHAAVAMDDWIDDEKTLREITLKKDYIGDWWNVPIEHLVECMMALSYFDASGMEYYLPAYMNAVVSNPEVFDVPRIKSSSWQVVYTMLPDTKDPELIEHFNEQFKNIQGGKKQVAIEFLRYIANCDAYNEHARDIANEALNHEFWSCSS
jgi:hypothetical protein